uniref:RED_N domain-containing protein n=1 Tax=Strongyloides stercoralis TaxID=6248 RepID=A0A0K0E3J7_STRER
MSTNTESFKSNEDFKKLLAARASTISEVPKESIQKEPIQKVPKEVEKKAQSSKSKHKNFKHRSKKEEFEGYGEQNRVLNEIMKKYKDRAGERRKEEMEEMLNKGNQKSFFDHGNGYFDPTAKFINSAEKRKQEIEESKYLGGDVEHTHLVKGLDYSLLNKVRSEMQAIEEMKEEELEKEFLSKKEDKVVFEIKSILAKKIEAAILKKNTPLVNSNFRRGRMAFSYDLEDEDADIPLTVLRSVPPEADLRPMKNKIDKLVYHKLSTVLSYLKIDPKKRKKLLEDKEEKKEDFEKFKNIDIFDGEDEYDPSSTKFSDSNKIKVKSGSYFENEKKTEVKKGKIAVDDIDIFATDEEKPETVIITKPSIQKRLLEIEGKGEDDAYSEYYPLACGFGESILSDDESDGEEKTKGKKKLPEKSEKNEGNRKQRREAKIQEGKLNQQLNQINKLLEKRKADEEKGISYKKPKF